MHIPTQTREISSQSRRRFWVYPERDDDELAKRVQEATTLPYPISYCLARRGLTTIADIRRYLKPDPRQTSQLESPIPTLHDPFLMKDLDRVVAVLDRARLSGERILVHGDYDVDGLTSATLFGRVLKDLGLNVEVAVPDRHVDGYGLSERIANLAYDAGIRTMLTCDVGIRETTKIATLVDREMTVLVTDHHEPASELPSCFAVVDPLRPDCPYPFKKLCGVGVAFKVLQGFLKRLGMDEVSLLYPHLDLVALGTICDIVDLEGENRVLVHAGLKRLKRTRNPGLRSLLDVAQIPPTRIDPVACGFYLGPRLNAIGRLDNAGIGLDLLMADDKRIARDLSLICDEANSRRKQYTERTEQEAVRQVESLGDLSNRWALALYGSNWHHGIVGIVASRIVERYGLPTFLFAPDDKGRWKGSGRAPNSGALHLCELLDRCQKQLAAYGGHAAAAGATLNEGGDAAALAFREAFNGAAAAVMTDDDRVPTLNVDMVIDLAEIDQEVFKYLRMFEPHGQGNQPMQFMARNVEISDVERTRSGAHLRIAVRQGEVAFQHAIGWRLSNQLPELIQTPRPYHADLIFRVGQDNRRGEAELQLEILDAEIRPRAQIGGSAKDTEQLLLPVS